MPRKTDILSISMPRTLTKEVNLFSKDVHQTKSEFVRNAIKEYILDLKEEREQALKSYAATKNDKRFTLEEVMKEFNVE